MTTKQEHWLVRFPEGDWIAMSAPKLQDITKAIGRSLVVGVDAVRVDESLALAKMQLGADTMRLNPLMYANGSGTLKLAAIVNEATPRQHIGWGLVKCKATLRDMLDAKSEAHDGT